MHCPERPDFRFCFDARLCRVPRADACIYSNVRVLQAGAARLDRKAAISGNAFCYGFQRAGRGLRAYKVNNCVLYPSIPPFPSCLRPPPP